MNNTKQLTLISKFTIAAMVTALLLSVTIQAANAGEFTSKSDTQTRLKAATLSSHTIKMTMVGGNTWGGGETLTIDFNEDASPAGFVVNGGATVVGDFDITTVKSSVVTEATILAACSAGTDNIGFSIDDATGIVTFTTCASWTPTDADSQIIIEYGTAATTGGSGANRVTNPATSGTKTISFAGTIGDTGTIQQGIVDDDAVSATATVDPTITFDIDMGTTCGGETGTPYSLAFGTVATSDVESSGTTDSVNAICLDHGHNGTDGSVITVVSAQAALKSTSVPGDTIGSSTALMAAGTENYGICVDETPPAGFTRATNFDGANCELNSNINNVGALTTSAQNIVTTAAPVASSLVEVYASVAVASSTEAHNDYSDTLTFIATATF